MYGPTVGRDGDWSTHWNTFSELESRVVKGVTTDPENTLEGVPNVTPNLLS